MKRVLVTLIVLVLGAAVGCSSDASSRKVAEQAKEIEILKTQIAALDKQQQPRHHYELRQDGLRTFRFDPGTGDICIQLTTTADWKKKETIRQGCEYQDMASAPDARAFLRAECLVVGDHDSCEELWAKK